MRTLILLAAVVGACVTSTVPDAKSQLLSPPSTVPPDARQCGRGASPTPGETTGSATLSDQLAQSKGVICPPAGVDPGIAAPPVGGGRTPVIPPPGTPGGDPMIVPK
jgi:hypothetical protein